MPPSSWLLVNNHGWVRPFGNELSLRPTHPVALPRPRTSCERRNTVRTRATLAQRSLDADLVAVLDLATGPELAELYRALHGVLQ